MKRRLHAQQVTESDRQRAEAAVRFLEERDIFLTRLRTADGRDCTPRWMHELIREDDHGRR